MEKLKNLVNPGSKKDDEVMYGSGRSDDPVHSGDLYTGNTSTGSGQGSHLATSGNAGHDPLAASANPTGTSQYDRGTTAGAGQHDGDTTGGASHGLREPYASRMPGGFDDDDDAATTASVSSGIPGQTQSRSAMIGGNEISTDKPLPREPVSGTGLGQSSLTGNRYPDRTIGNNSSHGGQSHIGRDTALGAGATATGAHRHEDLQQDNYAPEKTGRSFPPGGNSASKVHESATAASHSSSLANKVDPRVDSDGSRAIGNTGYGSTHSAGSGNGPVPSSRDQGSVNRDTRGAGAGAEAEAEAGALRSGTITSTGYGPESWQHEHQHHGHQYDGDPCESGETGQEGYHLVPGPHVTDTANRLDPHVGKAGTTGAFSGPHQYSDHDHRSEAAALADGAGVVGAGAFEANRGKHGTEGDIPSSGLDQSNTGRRGLDISQGSVYDNERGTATDASSGKTAGPHKSDILNKLDPRVDSDLSKQQSSRSGDHNHGRDAALTAAGGAGLYEAEKHRGNEPNLVTSSTTSGMRGSQGHDHHIGRDAALAGTGAAGLHETDRHHRSNQINQATSNPTPSMGRQGPQASRIDPHVDSTRSSTVRDESAVSSAGSGHQPATTSDHHYKRDAGLAGAGGIGVYEAEKHLGSHNRPNPGATPQDQLAGSGHQSALATGSSPDPSVSDPGAQPHTGHHTAYNPLASGDFGAGATDGAYEAQKTRGNGNNTRDAALLGDVGKAGAPAGHEYSQRDTAGYGSEPYHESSRGNHTGRDAAILGGAAGAGGLYEHERPKRDAENSQGGHAREEKTLEKEQSKEVKQHKELAKEEKAHEKAIEKAEKKHEKAVEKDERKHEKAIGKHEKDQEHGEKKHGGLLGFLHRDKLDKELKEEEAHRQAAAHPGHGKEMAAGPGASGLESGSGYDPLQGEHGSQSGVHDNPMGMGSGSTTHDAYGANDSGPNKLHKDPPAKVLESRGY